MTVGLHDNLKYYTKNFYKTVNCGYLNNIHFNVVKLPVYSFILL